MRSLTAKISLFMLSIIVLCSALATQPLRAEEAAPTEAALPYDIVGHWAAAPIERCRAYGVMGGYADGSFRPDNPVTRAEFAAMVNRAFNLSRSSAISFNDVGSDDWYYSDISIAVSMGVLSGYGDGRVGPNDPVSREQAFAILARVLRVPAASSSYTAFRDEGDISEWAKGSLLAMANEGYVGGWDNGIHPQVTLTRAQTAQALCNVFGTIVDETRDAEGETFDGNVTIRKPGVELSNAVIEGNLYITEGLGDGDFLLDQLDIAKTLLVAGGGQHTGTLRNLTASRVLADKPAAAGTQPLHLKVEGQALGIVDVRNKLVLSGAAHRVNMASEADFSLTPEGSVGEIIVPASSSGVTLRFDAGSRIEHLNIDGEARSVRTGSGLRLSGSGSVIELYVSGEGVVIDAGIAFGSVIAEAGIALTIDGQVLIGTGEAFDDLDGGDGVTAPPQEPEKTGVTVGSVSISGGDSVGQTLTAKLNKVVNGTPSVSYQWWRVKANGSEAAKIEGADQTSYQIGTADVGYQLYVVIAPIAGRDTEVTSDTSNKVAVKMSTVEVTDIDVPEKTRITFTASEEISAIKLGNTVIDIGGTRKPYASHVGTKWTIYLSSALSTSKTKLTISREQYEDFVTNVYWQERVGKIKFTRTDEEINMADLTRLSTHNDSFVVTLTNATPKDGDITSAVTLSGLPSGFSYKATGKAKDKTITVTVSGTASSNVSYDVSGMSLKVLADAVSETKGVEDSDETKTFRLIAAVSVGRITFTRTVDTVEMSSETAINSSKNTFVLKLDRGTPLPGTIKNSYVIVKNLPSGMDYSVEGNTSDYSITVKITGSAYSSDRVTSDRAISIQVLRNALMETRDTSDSYADTGFKLKAASNLSKIAFSIDDSDIAMASETALGSNNYFVIRLSNATPVHGSIDTSYVTVGNLPSGLKLSSVSGNGSTKTLTLTISGTASSKQTSDLTNITVKVSTKAVTETSGLQDSDAIGGFTLIAYGKLGKIEFSATDAVITMESATKLGTDNTYVLSLTKGTPKAGDITSAVSVTGLPSGLSVDKAVGSVSGSNKLITIVIKGDATTAITGSDISGIKVRVSAGAVSETVGVENSDEKAILTVVTYKETELGQIEAGVTSSDIKMTSETAISGSINLNVSKGTLKANAPGITVNGLPNGVTVTNTNNSIAIAINGTLDSAVSSVTVTIGTDAVEEKGALAYTSSSIEVTAYEAPKPVLEKIAFTASGSAVVENGEVKSGSIRVSITTPNCNYSDVQISISPSNVSGISVGAVDGSGQASLSGMGITLEAGMTSVDFTVTVSPTDASSDRYEAAQPQIVPVSVTVTVTETQPDNPPTPPEGEGTGD